jgi:hypothetical protein
MVYDDVDHKQHSPPMNLRTKVFEILSGSETIVELSDVGDPVSMVGVPIRRARAIVILVYRTDPNSGKAHGLYVV